MIGPLKTVGIYVGADWAVRKPPVVLHCADVESTCREVAERGVENKTQPTAMAWWNVR